MAFYCFWFSLLFILYTYIGYPMLLALLARIHQKPVLKAPYTPNISILIAVWNEEKNIENKIKDLSLQNYPVELTEIIVVSDGSTDKTNQILARLASRSIKVVYLEQHLGKAAALNTAVEAAKGEILVFTDARQTFQSEAISQLTANFTDPSVGAVSGELLLTGDQESSFGYSVGSYWKYEKWLRNRESQIDSMLGATGAIYAIRRELHKPIPADTILDDMLIPFQAILAGYRAVLDSEAIAYDKVTDNSKREFERKVRTLTGNYQLLLYCPTIFSPLRNRVFFYFVSHKIFRLLVPFFLIALLVSNLFLAREGYYSAVLACQLLFLSMALVGHLTKNSKMQKRPFAAATTIVLLNLAAVIAFRNFLTSNYKIWVK